MSDFILTLNAGSSSLKFAAFAASSLELEGRGEVESVSGAAKLTYRPQRGEPIDRTLGAGEGRDPDAALDIALATLAAATPDLAVRAVGHRIVHGGLNFAAPVRIDGAVYRELEALEPLAPLHQPHNLAGVRAARARFPEAPQIGCFDTAFHRGHAFAEDAYALPRKFYDEGLRRYGFHGLSYEYVSGRLAEIAPDIAKGRVVIAHLGSGASMCGLRNGISVASTMGFSTLDGLPMGTRPGQLDPGVVLYLMSAKGFDAGGLTDLFYRHSGLVGLSGLSNDWREIEKSDRPTARDAVDYFVHRIRYELGGLAATLGGLDALVFTGGIGEHSASLRAAVASNMDWLGLTLDDAANRQHLALLSAPASRVEVYVIPTDEERRIAEHTREISAPA